MATIDPDLLDSLEYQALFSMLATEQPGYRAFGGALLAVERLAQAARLRDAANELVGRALDDAAVYVGDWAPVDWEAIGRAMGVTKQAASQMHKRRSRAK